MATELRENNKVLLTGTVATPFSFSHESFGEKFYITYLSSMRFSGNSDLIPVMVSERIVDVDSIIQGTWVNVTGDFRSYNIVQDDKTRLVLTVFAREFECAEEVYMDDVNDVSLKGFVVKTPVYRKTPLGREITDLIIAVHRSYGKSDYIPCLCWGRNARYASSFNVGDHVELCGRIQSREYCKQIEGKEPETRTAYEVSASKIEVLN